MKYDTYSVEQIERMIRYCDQRIAKTTSAESRRQHEAKRANLVAALARKQAQERRV